MNAKAKKRLKGYSTFLEYKCYLNYLLSTAKIENIQYQLGTGKRHLYAFQIGIKQM